MIRASNRCSAIRRPKRNVWYAKHKAVPINHLMVMRTADVAADPDTAREVYRLLLEGKRLAGAPPMPDPLPFGIEANRPSLELIAEYAYQQTADTSAHIGRRNVRGDP